MAKYTELLSEYLEAGGELPASFEQIDGFTDLFIGRYCDREIGFETPTLFTIKLTAKADLIIPAYKQRIDDLNALRTNLDNPTKTRLKTGEISRIYGAVDETTENSKTGEISRTDKGDTTNAQGARARLEANQPINPYNPPTPNYPDDYLRYPTNVIKDNPATDKETVDLTHTETYKEYKDTDHHTAISRTDTEKYNDIKEIESGYTPSEALALWGAIEGSVKSLKESLLNEFKNLFMVVY